MPASIGNRCKRKINNETWQTLLCSFADKQQELLNSFAYKSSYTWWLIALVSFMLLFRLGASPIYILDEAKNAQCAREMLQRHDMIVPTFNGELRTDKPVLHYYFMMLAYKLFGVSAFTARIFSALLGILTVAITFIFTKRNINELTALCAALVLCVSPQFLFEFRLAVPDPYLIFFITGGLFTAFTYLHKNKLVYLLIAATSFALATLAKGLVALALPGVCLLIWIIIKRKWKLVLSWKMIPAFALLAAITLPWYIAVDKATNHAWTRGFFIEHNINRFSGSAEGHGGFFLITLLFVLIGLLPFTSFVGEVVRKRQHVFTDDLVKFSGIVVLAFVVFFSVSGTKLPNYPMPCYPFAAIILGRYLSTLISGEASHKAYPIYILIVLGCAIPVAGYVAISNEKEATSLASLSMLLLIVPVTLVVLLALGKKASAFNKIIFIAGAYTLFDILALHFIYPTLYKQNPVAKTLSIVQKQTVFSYKHIDRKSYVRYKSNRYTITEDEGEFYNPAYNFYLDKPVQKFYNIDTLQVALQQNPSAVIVSRKEYESDLQKLNLTKLAEHHDLFELPTTVVYVVKQ